MIINTFTNTGLMLSAAATSGESIILKNIYISTEQYTEDTIRTQPISYFSTRSVQQTDVETKFISAGYDVNKQGFARIVINLLNKQTTEINIKSIIITASLSTNTEDEQTLYGYSSDVGLVLNVMNDTNEVNLSTNFALSFRISSTTNITIAESIENYLLASEVERFVTSHSTSGSNVGDNQNIYGKKTFKSNTYHEGDIFADESTLYADEIHANDISINGDNSILRAPIQGSTGNITTPKGCIIGVYTTLDQIGKQQGPTGTLGYPLLNPGVHIRVDTGSVPIAMYDASANKWTPSTLYLSYGQYCLLTGANPTSDTSTFVFLLLMRVG